LNQKTAHTEASYPGTSDPSTGYPDNGRQEDAEGCCPIDQQPPLDDDTAAELAHLYAALADPVRLRLLSLIAATQEICSCDLVGPLAKSQPTVSHHTKILADAGLIRGEKRGRWVHWSVAPDRIEFVTTVLR
jgi:ArsR family transcriptional regulator